jgi:hypothetical protein
MLLQFANCLTNNQIAKDLSSVLSVESSIYTASEPEFLTNITARFDVYSPPSYGVAVKPARVQDVQKVVCTYIYGFSCS